MKAIVFSKYGDPRSLHIKQKQKTTPASEEVLVKVRAAAINDYDWSLVRGKPHIYRLLFGILKPKANIPGMELSGIVEHVGENVSNFKVGDCVYGDISQYGFGALAEYTCVNYKALKQIPPYMSFEDAAAIPHASLLALQGLMQRPIKQNDKVLINGAGGGMGLFALQIAKLYTSDITGVDTGKKLKQMKSLGFSKVIDYKQTNFVQEGVTYDLILDAKTNQSPQNYLKALNKHGHYVTVGGQLPKILQIILSGPIIKKISGKRLSVLGLKQNEGLNYIEDLYRRNEIRSIIDGPYDLQQVPQLLTYFGSGEHLGKIIISLN